MRAKFINEEFKEESDPVRDMGIGDPLRHIAIRQIHGRREIFVLLGFREDDYWMWVYGAGTIGWNYDRSREYASFIHNTKLNNIKGVKSVKEFPQSYRKPTDHEMDLIKIALEEEVNQKYLDLIQEKTGIDLRA